MEGGSSKYKKSTLWKNTWTFSFFTFSKVFDVY